MPGLSSTAPLLSRVSLRPERREATGLCLIGGRIKAPKQAAGGRRSRKQEIQNVSEYVTSPPPSKSRAP
jgi:hypothetical protein